MRSAAESSGGVKKEHCYLIGGGVCCVASIALLFVILGAMSYSPIRDKWQSTKDWDDWAGVLSPIEVSVDLNGTVNPSY